MGTTPRENDITIEFDCQFRVSVAHDMSGIVAHNLSGLG